MIRERFSPTISRREFLKRATALLTGTLLAISPELSRPVKASGNNTKVSENILPAIEQDGNQLTQITTVEVPGTTIRLGQHFDNSSSILASRLNEKPETELVLNQQLAEFFDNLPFIAHFDESAFPLQNEVIATKESENGTVTVEKISENSYRISFERAGMPQTFEVFTTYFEAADYKFLQSLYGSETGNEKVVMFTFKPEKWASDDFQYDWNMYFLAEGSSASLSWEAGAIKTKTDSTDRQKLNIEALLEKISFGFDPSNLRYTLYDSCFDITNQKTQFKAVNHFVSPKVKGFAHSYIGDENQPVAGDGTTTSTFYTIFGMDYMRGIYCHELLHAAVTINDISGGNRQTNESLAEIAMLLSSYRDNDRTTYQRILSFVRSDIEGVWNGINLRSYEPGQIIFLFAQLGNMLQLSPDVIVGLKGLNATDYFPDPESISQAVRQYMTLAKQLTTTLKKGILDPKYAGFIELFILPRYHNLTQLYAPFMWGQHLLEKNISLQQAESLSLEELDCINFMKNIANNGYEQIQKQFHDIFLRIWISPEQCTPYEQFARSLILSKAQEQINLQSSQLLGTNVVLSNDYGLVTFHPNENDPLGTVIEPVKIKIGDLYDNDLQHGWMPLFRIVTNLTGLPEECFRPDSEFTVYVTNTSESPLSIVSPNKRTAEEERMYGASEQTSAYIQTVEPGEEAEIRFDQMGGSVGDLHNWGGKCMLVANVFDHPSFHQYFAKSIMPPQEILDQKIQVCTFRMGKRDKVPETQDMYFPIISHNT